jgi:hypothetical protein
VLNETLIPDLRACLATGDVDGFGRRLEHFVFGIAHENLQQEAGYRALLQALFLLMAVPTQSEPSNWGGRADHEIQIGNRVYVFEVKYNRSQGAGNRQSDIRHFQYKSPSTPRGSRSLAIATGPTHHRGQTYMVPRPSRQWLRAATTPKCWQTAVKTHHDPKVEVSIVVAAVRSNRVGVRPARTSCCPSNARFHHVALHMCDAFLPSHP